MSPSQRTRHFMGHSAPKTPSPFLDISGTTPDITLRPQPAGPSVWSPIRAGGHAATRLPEAVLDPKFASPHMHNLKKKVSLNSQQKPVVTRGKHLADVPCASS